MTLYSDQVVVLRSWKLGESDRIVSMYGAQNGKIRAVAKGARKTKSKFGGRIEPISFLNVQIWKGNSELHILNQADSIELFPSTKGDFEKLRKALAIVEVVDELVGESDGDFDIFRLLVRVLGQLEKDDSPFILGAFLWRLLQIQGVAPDLSLCMECGSTEGINYLSPDGSGILCEVHRGGRFIDDEVRHLIEMALGGEVSRLLIFDDLVARVRFEEVAIELVENLIAHRVKALHIDSQY
ncbi:MAG: DNA repair protein RecO [Actinomycetota bacterium]|nr:DNA repair protein RecO [Actinomycetota bacterium]